VGNRVHRARGLLFPDADARRFIQHNRKAWRGWTLPRPERVVLADFWGFSETNIARSYFLNVLARYHRAAIRTFAPPSRMPNRALHAVYESLNATGHVVTSCTRSQQERRRTLSREIVPPLRSKRDLYGLEVLGIWVGIDIYETYLRRYNEPTVRLDDPRLRQTVEEGIGLVLFWKDYFATHDVAAVVVSHDCYLQFNVACKVAYGARVPVYLPNARGLWYVDRPHATYAHFADYRRMFSNLSLTEQKDGLAWAQRQIGRRLDGEVGVDMPYASVSAFRGAGRGRRVVRRSGKPKILICAPCFTDNPHAYGGLLFLDFYEWIRHLGEIAKHTDYDWYVKTHPDPLPVTLDTIHRVLAEYPHIGLVPHDTSHHDMAAAGIDVVLTPYGSVGHEYPALGVQVINAGYNPHVAYSFNQSPKSLDEYDACLANLDGLRNDIDVEELREFYYMHHGYTLADDLVLPSYRQALQDLTTQQRMGSAIYAYFLDGLTEERHRKIIEKMQAFIDSGKSHYFSRGPE